MLSKEEVLHIAKLARLELTEEEVQKMQKDLSAILDYFNLLKKAKLTKKGKPASAFGRKKSASGETKSAKGSGVAKQGNSLRKDKVEPRPASLANNLVAQAPDKKDDYIKVKAIL